MIKRIFYLFLCVAICYGVSRFCHKETAGFRIAKITDNLFVGEDSSPSHEEQMKISSLLSQRYTYFARGLESFAFLSEDGQYVLKIMNNRTQSKLYWLDFFPSLFSSMRCQLQKKLQRSYESYKIAYSELKEETALVFLHLHATDYLPNHLTLVDNLNISHVVDLNKMAFVLQKRASLCYPYLLSLKNAGKTEEAKEALVSLLHLLVARCKRGIADKDPLIRTNVGFIEQKPVLIDVGPFSYNSSIQERAVYKEEILRITASLKDWLKNNYPELLGSVEEELNALL